MKPLKQLLFSIALLVQDWIPYLDAICEVVSSPLIVSIAAFALNSGLYFLVDIIVTPFTVKI